MMQGYTCAGVVLYFAPHIALRRTRSSLFHLLSFFAPSRVDARMAVLLVLLIPLTEEIFFRHLLFLRVANAVGLVPAYALQSLWFATNHQDKVCVLSLIPGTFGLFG